jgi:Calcineurin-like phosphoesterase
MTGYDVIGDVHGHAERLRGLLGALGYVDRGGVYRHDERRAVFVGDLIDRGPEQLKTLRIARAMVDAGSALVVLGNHEFNAVAFAILDGEGGWCREHSPKNLDQHADFLREFPEGSPEHRHWIDWFRTFPMWLDLGGLRVVHACWHRPSMDVLAPHLTASNALTDEVVGAKEGTPLFDAVEILLKGPEIPLGDGRSYLDKDGHPRTKARYRWWDPGAVTLRGGAELPGGSLTAAELPDVRLDVDRLPRYTDPVPVIHGHYWRTGTPEIASPTIACVDYSAGKGGDLVAYRWSGEATLRDDRFVSFPGRP